MEKKLNLDVLSGMNIPEIKVEEEPIVPFTDEEVDDIKNGVIQEVNSLEDFMKDAPEEIKKQVGIEEPEKEAEQEADPGESGVPKEATPANTEEEASIVRGLADWAKSEQFFDFKDEEFKDDVEFLKDKFSEYANAQVDKKLAEYPEIIHDLAKSYKAGVPLDELIYTKSRQIEYSTLTEDQVKKDPELCKKLVTDRLLETGYTEEQAQKKVKKYEDALILEDEGIEAMGWLQTFEKRYEESLKKEAEVRAVEAQKQREASLKEIENSIMSSTEFIPGIPVTEEQKKRIFKAYTEMDSKGKTELIKAIENDPKAWAKITQFLVIEGGKLENIEKKLKTKVAKETAEVVNTYKEKPTFGKIDIKAIAKWRDKMKNKNN